MTLIQRQRKYVGVYNIETGTMHRQGCSRLPARLTLDFVAISSWASADGSWTRKAMKRKCKVCKPSPPISSGDHPGLGGFGSV